jgi:polar amino acid transport system substrate-binding protein
VKATSSSSGPSPDTTLSPDIVSAFSPTGRLRASINLGNPILAGRDASSGEPVGVSVDLATAFAQRLGVELDLVVWQTAKQSVDAVTNELADIGFFAIDPQRGAGIQFTDAYVLIEGAYLVRTDSPLQDPSQVDQPGVTVVTAKGSAYDLHLTRELKHAAIQRVQTSSAVVDAFLADNADAAASVKQILETDMKRVSGVRLLPGNFMVIRQAMGTPKSRGALAASTLSAFVEEMKASGFVEQSLQRHRIQGARVAPTSGQ